MLKQDAKMGLMEETAESALGAGLGMLTANWQDKRQLKQQQKLTDQQIEAQKQMGAYNQQLAMDMWEKTNYAAQVEQMKKAGLNVGLMYKGAGAGGTTQTPTGSVGAGTAQGGSGEIGMGLQIGLQKAMQEAQINNLNANTEKTKVEAAKTAGIDTTEGQTRVAEATERMNAIKQNVTNAQTQNAIMEYEKQIKAIESQYATMSQEAAIGQLKAATGKLVEDTVQQAQQNKITGETMQSVIQEAKLNMIGQSLMNELTREKIITQVANTEETWAKINKISEEIIRMTAQTEQGARGLDQADTKLILEKIANEFNYGDTAEIIRWVNTIGGAVGEISGMVMKGKQIRNVQHRNRIDEWKAHKD